MFGFAAKDSYSFMDDPEFKAGLQRQGEQALREKAVGIAASACPPPDKLIGLAKEVYAYINTHDEALDPESPPRY